ncbi:hypothetical protein [Kitasatospora sp. NPDC002965]|uniref:hypothetical protein n=1 Tax=Kitasatospora sp. NPDC002965 TaxID=3154775 RepID=UPI0033B7C326
MAHCAASPVPRVLAPERPGCGACSRSFPLREMSDGYRTVAALVVDILKQLHDAAGWSARLNGKGLPV